MASSTRNKPLSKEEMEEEEIRHELTSAGFYEENMNLQEMRDILQALNASKSTNFMNVDTSPVSSPSTSKSQSMPESAKTVLERPMPSFSYRNAVIQGNDGAVAGPSRNKEKSPENVFNSSFKTDVSQTDSPSNEKNSNVNSFGTKLPKTFDNLSDYNENPNDGPRLRSHDKKKLTPAMLKKSNLDRWKLNPYEIVDNGDYKPHKDLENANLKLNLENLTEEYIESQKFQEMYDQVSKKMDKLHDQFIKAEVSRHMENPKSQWGSPIKVATKNGWNGSLDKNPGGEKPEPAGRVSTRGSHDRATKRKALNSIAAVARNDSSHENSNPDDSDDEFVDTKKRKCQQAKKGEEAAKKSKEVVKTKPAVVQNNDFEMIEVDKENALKESQPSDFEVFDNSDLRSLRKNTHTDSAQNPKVIEDKPQYPIRIIPPNPAKKCNKGPRAKNNKKNAASENNNIIKNNMGISDDEITKVLHTLDEEIKNKDNDCIEITDEIKPPPVSKPLQKKLNLAQTHLKSVIDEEIQKSKTEERIKKKKEEEEAQKKNEVIKKRLKAIEDEEKLNEEKKKKNREKEEVFRSILNAKQAGKITRAHIKKIARPNFEEYDEDALLRGDEDDEPMITHANIVTKSLCPICQKSFPPDKIEEHASECVAFSMDDEVNINKPSTSYDSCYSCSICKKFRTINSNNYEEHVIMCRQEAEDSRTRIHV